MGVHACDLCGKPFEQDDYREEVHDGEETYYVHRPCLGETVGMSVLGAEAVSMAEEPLSDQRKKQGLYRKLAFCIKVMGKCVIELTALESPFLTKMAEVVAALQAQTPEKPYKYQTKRGWSVSCPSCSALVLAMQEEDRANKHLTAYAWHRNDCCWALRQVALSGL